MKKYKNIIFIGLLILSLNLPLIAWGKTRTGYYDEVLQGDIGEISKTHITLEGNSYPFCKTFEVYDPNGKMIDPIYLIGALQIKIYIKKGCVERVDILKFD